MGKATGQYMASAAFYILLVIGIAMAISLNLVLPENTVGLIGSSSNPRLIVWFISVLFSSAIMFLTKIGIMIPVVKSYFENHDNTALPYFFSLPIKITLPILVLAAIGVAFLWPVCESPAVNFSVTTLDNSTINFNGATITAKTGSILTIEAVLHEKTMVSCKWSSSGQAIRTIGPLSSCVTQINLSDKAGKGFITLALSKNFCSIVSTRPLEIITTP